MATNRKEITWASEFDQISKRIVEHYENDMLAMGITPYEDDDQINIDAVIHFLMQEADSRLDDEIDVESSFRQAWHEAMTGQTRPLEEFLKELDHPRKAGSAQGQIKMSDDFDAPLPDFDEYME